MHLFEYLLFSKCYRDCSIDSHSPVLCKSISFRLVASQDAKNAWPQSKVGFEKITASCAAISCIALPIYYKSIRWFCPAVGKGSGPSGNHKECCSTSWVCADGAYLCGERNLPLPLCNVHGMNLLQRANQGEPNASVAIGKEDLLKTQKIPFSING